MRRPPKDSYESCFPVFEDGLVESKTNCIESPNASASPCYANVVCYTGATAHNVGDCENVVNEVYKN